MNNYPRKTLYSFSLNEQIKNHLKDYYTFILYKHIIREMRWEDGKIPLIDSFDDLKDILDYYLEIFCIELLYTYDDNPLSKFTGAIKIHFVFKSYKLLDDWRDALKYIDKTKWGDILHIGRWAIEIPLEFDLNVLSQKEKDILQYSPLIRDSLIYQRMVMNTNFVKVEIEDRGIIEVLRCILLKVENDKY